MFIYRLANLVALLHLGLFKGALVDLIYNWLGHWSGESESVDRACFHSVEDVGHGNLLEEDLFHRGSEGRTLNGLRGGSVDKGADRWKNYCA